MAPVLTPPDWLCKDAVVEWDRILATGVAIGETDRAVFAVYCQSYARWMQAEKVIEDKGTTVEIFNEITGELEKVSASPQVAISRGALASMLKAAAQLGLRANVTRDQSAGVAPQADAGVEWFN